MDIFGAFARGEAARRAGSRMMVFDWDKAARIIKERGATEASAGLSEDWEYTGGEILSDGKPVPKEDTYVYLASLWATPELDIDGDLIDCWKYQEETPGWDENTYWPQSALELAFESGEGRAKDGSGEAGATAGRDPKDDSLIAEGEAP